ncbi:MAG: asparaginase [Gammaproteobacteria bacterium]|nr:asparaginase [Gammaproteobacteria bacterium]
MGAVRKLHSERVEKWLERLGLSDDDLECGPVRPGHAASADCLVLEGTPPGRRHNNCSGKHMGMLTLARHLSVPTRVLTTPHIRLSQS